MVERIVAAGAELLRREGYEGFSTNRVAREAGVSPGSLYQYFPDKQAIVDEVIDRWSAEVSERVAAALAKRVGEEGPAMVRGVVESLVLALEAEAPLLRVVLVELPHARTRASTLALERRVQELAIAYLAGRDPAGLPAHTVKAWMLVVAVENVVVRWVVDEPGIPRGQLVDELTALCVGYLAA